MLNLRNGIPDSGCLFPERWGALGNKIGPPCLSVSSHSVTGAKRRQSEVGFFWCEPQSPTRHARKSKPRSSKILSGFTGRRGRGEACHASSIVLWGLSKIWGHWGICRTSSPLYCGDYVWWGWQCLYIQVDILTLLARYLKILCFKASRVSFQITFHVSQVTICIYWQTPLGRAE